MLLAVFAGIAMFGFWGIVIGPVLMIIIVTTISVYLAVYKGVPTGDRDGRDEAETGKKRAWLPAQPNRPHEPDARYRRRRRRIASREDAARPPAAQ